MLLPPTGEDDRVLITGGIRHSDIWGRVESAWRDFEIGLRDVEARVSTARKLISEACQLVLEAAAAAPGHGEVMVLDMGRPQKIVDVARALIRMSGRSDVKIDFTGLRPGEKLTEDLVANAETITRTKNPLVTSAQVIPLEEKQIGRASCRERV